MVQANQKHVAVSYKVSNLVYLSMKNISLPKGWARKLAPKNLGLFPRMKVLRDGTTYQLDLSDELMKRGINHLFHASLLKLHVPCDDRRFPGRLLVQIPGFEGKSEEWIVDLIVLHHRRGVSSKFEIQWKAGDRTWVPYHKVAHLIALDRYCELMGVRGPQHLPASYPKKGEMSDALVGVIRVVSGGYKTKRSGKGGTHFPSMTQMISTEEWLDCVLYKRQINLYCCGTGRHPGSACSQGVSVIQAITLLTSTSWTHTHPVPRGLSQCPKGPYLPSSMCNTIWLSLWLELAAVGWA